MTAENIAKLCASENNSPGIKAYVAVVAACGVVSIPERIAHVPGDDSTQYFIDGDIQLKEGYKFAVWHFRYPKDEEPFKFEQAGELDAEVTNITGQFFIPGVTAKNKRNLNQAKRGEQVMLYWDENNTFPQLIGETSRAATLRSTQQHKPKNGFLVNVTGELKDFPAFYRGTIPYITEE